MSQGKIVIYSKRNPLSVMISEIASRSASRIVCCSSVEQTIATCQYEMPDLVIILSLTPFMDGSGFIARLRHDDRRRPPIYVISWQHSENAVLSMLECGVDQYFTFPISLTRLQNKIAEQMKNRVTR